MLMRNQRGTETLEFSLDAGEESDANTISRLELTVLSHRWRPRRRRLRDCIPSDVIRLEGGSLASSPQRLSWHEAEGGRKEARNSQRREISPDESEIKGGEQLSPAERE